jgi:hypothetical protein
MYLKVMSNCSTIWIQLAQESSTGKHVNWHSTPSKHAQLCHHVSDCLVSTCIIVQGLTVTRFGIKLLWPVSELSVNFPLLWHAIVILHAKPVYRKNAQHWGSLRYECNYRLMKNIWLLWPTNASTQDTGLLLKEPRSISSVPYPVTLW